MTLLTRCAFTFVFTLFSAVCTLAEDAGDSTLEDLVRPVGDSDLSEFVWKKRPIIIFADSENDPAFIDQMRLLDARKEALAERDVVVLFDTDPEILSPARKRMRPRGFMLTILSKEGRVQARKPFPWSVREITRSIDKLPIREREIRDAKTSRGR